jgi:hypothetical protein
VLLTATFVFRISLKADGGEPSRTSRGFLPWRLSDDGPGASCTVREGPSSETLHNSGLMHRSKRLALFDPRRRARAGSLGKPCIRVGEHAVAK